MIRTFRVMPREVPPTEPRRTASGALFLSTLSHASVKHPAGHGQRAAHTSPLASYGQGVAFCALPVLLFPGGIGSQSAAKWSPVL
jgi:hypothetical protein